MNKCLNCNKETKNPKFCSKSCSAKVNNRGVNRWANICGTTEYKECLNCKEQIHWKRTYCSNTCQLLYQSPYDSDGQRLKVKRIRNRENNARYRARVKHQTPVGEDREAIREFYANCPIGYEVDHIYPISKGGSHTIGNLQYLTIRENRTKSNKV